MRTDYCIDFIQGLKKHFLKKAVVEWCICECKHREAEWLSQFYSNKFFCLRIKLLGYTAMPVDHHFLPGIPSTTFS